MEKQIIIGSRYQVIRKIGEGGMAKVYLVYDTKLEMNLALKILRKENVIDKKVRNFKREAIALSMMDDENIVQVFDVGEEGNIHYIATEFVDGMTVKDYVMTCSPIPVEEVVVLAQQVIRGIEHAHQKGVIHKDIKSQNILLDENKKVKITDFGIASIMDDDYTKTQSLMGTPQYVAPEILNRDILTEQSDLYSIGILMFEMLVGKAPFTGEKPGIIMIKQMNHPIPSVINERADVPQSLENVVIKATAKRLENRYKTAAEMLEDLETVFDQERKYEERLILEDDVLTDDKLEKTIVLNSGINLTDIKADDAKVEKSKKRIYLFSAIGAFVLAMLAAIILSISNPPVVMPDVVGKTQEEAVNTLVLKGYDNSAIEIILEPSDTVESGLVISTVPPADTQINPDADGAGVIVKVSSGLETNTMPNVVMKLSSGVIAEFEKNGFTVNVVDVDNSAVAGTIVDQAPVAGESITVDDTITLYVSTGNFLVPVPNFTGLTKESADTWASDYKITVQTEFACNDQFDKGIIYKQEPAIGENVSNGGSIKVYISDGACAQPDPVTPEEPVTVTDPQSTNEGA